MKTINLPASLVVLLSLTISGSVLYSGTKNRIMNGRCGLPEKDPVEMMVISDIHIMDPELVVKNGKAFAEYVANDRKMLLQGPDICRRIVDSVLVGKPDVLLIAGDLTKDGEYRSHILTTSILQPLIENGIRVYVVPGNHDVSNPHSVTYHGDSTSRTRTVSPEEFREIYSQFGYGSAISKDNASLSYTVQLSESLRLIAIDACLYKENDFGKNTCVTAGRIADTTMEYIKEECRKAKEDGVDIIAMMHHGLVSHWNWQDRAMPEYLVEDWKKIAGTFGKLGLNFVFTGHFHAQDISVYGKGKKAVYDIQTGSAVSHPVPVRTVCYTGDSLKTSTVKLAVSDPELNDLSLKYARAGVSSIVKATVPGNVPENLAEQVSELISAAYVSHISGDENMPADYEETLDSTARHIGCYSRRHAFILRHLGRNLYTDTGIPDNATTIAVP